MVNRLVHVIRQHTCLLNLERYSLGTVQAVITLLHLKLSKIILLLDQNKNIKGSWLHLPMV